MNDRGLLRFVLACLLFIVPGWALAHDLGLTTIDLSPTSGGTHIRLETPLSRLVVRDSLGPKPTGIQIDQSIRRLLFLRQGNARLQPAAAEIHIDSQADMIRWEATVADQPPSLSLGQRFYPLDQHSVTIVTIHDPSGAAKTVTLTAQRPGWNQSADSPLFAGFRDAFLRLDALLLVVALALVPFDGLSVMLGIVALWVGMLVAIRAQGTPPAIATPAALLVVVAANLWPQKSPKLTPWIRTALALGAGPVLGSIIHSNHNPPSDIGEEIAYLLAFGCIGGLMLALGKKPNPILAKVTYVASLAIGMAGSYWLVSTLLSR